MKRFFIAGDELKCELHVRDSLLEVIRINYKDGDTFLGNGYITLNEKKWCPGKTGLETRQSLWRN